VCSLQPGLCASIVATVPGANHGGQRSRALAGDADRDGLRRVQRSKNQESIRPEPVTSESTEEIEVRFRRRSAEWNHRGPDSIICGSKLVAAGAAFPDPGPKPFPLTESRLSAPIGRYRSY